MEQSQKVYLHVYDLSQGMARQMSRQLLGKQIDGIWHTGIIVYQKEFYFGGGICTGYPGQTPYGQPIQTIELGETQIPYDLFEQFLQEINPQFTINTYDLFKNNCNNFSDTCANFLIGSSIPEHILNLPNEVLNTQLGQTFRPFIDNFQNQLNQNSQGNQMFIQNTNQVQNNSNRELVVEIMNENQFIDLIEKNKGVVIDFYSNTCPPCKKIKPVLEDLAKKYQAICPTLKFCSLNVQNRELASLFDITSIPTFMFYFDFEIIQRFSGANEKQLKDEVQNLADKLGIIKENNQINNIQQTKQQYQPPAVLKFKVYDPSYTQLFLYQQANFEMPINKIKQFYQNQEKPLNYDLFEQFVLKPEVKNNNSELLNFLIDQMLVVQENDQMPFLDIMRSLVLEEQICQHLIQNHSGFLNQKLNELKDKEGLSKGVQTFLLRLICNMFQFQVSLSFLYSNNEILRQIVSKQYKNGQSINAQIMIIFNISQLQNSLQLTNEHKLFYLNVLNNISTESIDDNSIFWLAQSVSNLLYQQPQLVANEISSQINRNLKKYVQSKDEKVLFIIIDLDNIVNGKLF